jgi:hypothetical protein
MSAPLTAVQWLVRAEEARLDAAAMNDPQAKRMMLVMAAGYERLAAHATWRVIATSQPAVMGGPATGLPARRE